jgi:prepilin-type N-terminal cleavage/methylation domain-containing protein
MKKSGFTLVEIMIVVAIIGLLAAIAIPSFVKARNTSQQSACINNMRQIDSGKEQGGMAYGVAEGTAVAAATVNTYIKGGAPECPGGGAYTYSVLGTAPLCVGVTVTSHVFN